MKYDKTKTRTGLTDGLRNIRQIIAHLNALEANNEQIEYKLSASEVRYRRLFETAQDGILILNAGTGEITDVNPFLSEMLGYENEHFLGKQLWEIGFFKDKDASKQAFQELQTNRFIRYEDLPLETKDGRSMDVEFVSNVYSVDNEEVIQCNIRDITDRKKAENALIKAKKNLEIKVKKRTAKLFQANKRLRYYASEVIQAHEDQRKNIACELHDQIGQSLTSLKVMMGHALISSEAESRSILTSAEAVASGLIGQVREMSLNLRPSMLDDLGLLPALLWHLERYTSQTKIKVVFEQSGLERSFDSNISISVYRIMQEALTNIARHADVKEANVHIWAEEKSIQMVINDHGSGFNPAHLSMGTSIGLSGMSERALLLGGSFDIVSNPGTGTHLTVKLPLTRKSDKPLFKTEPKSRRRTV